MGRLAVLQFGRAFRPVRDANGTIEVADPEKDSSPRLGALVESEYCEDRQHGAGSLYEQSAAFRTTL